MDNKEKFFLLSGLFTGILYYYPIIARVVPDTDSGVFLYIGQILLDGGVPYRDVFDHKGPLLYVINAIGILTGGGHVRGIWVIELLFFVLSVYLSYVTLKLIFSQRTAILGTIVWLLAIPVLMIGGNYSEEYSILFQWLVVWGFVKYSESKQKIFHLLFGITLGAVILLRPNLIGMHLSIAIYYLVKCLRRQQWVCFFTFIFQSLLGLGLMVIPFLVFFHIHGALGDLWDQLFIFNRAYATGAWSIRFQNLISMILYNLPYGMPFWVIAGILTGVMNFRRAEVPMMRSLLYIAFMAFILSILLIILSLRRDINYSIALLPAYALLSSFFIEKLIQTEKKIFFYLLCMFLLISAIYPLRKWAACTNQNLVKRKNPYTSLITYIQQHTTPQDKILFWGAETRMHLLTQRSSPTKYVYQWPLYRVGYVNDFHIEHFFQDIQSQSPMLIIDARNGNFPPLDESERKKWLDNYQSPYHRMPDKMNFIFDYVQTHYTRLDTVVQPGWVIYKRKDSN